MSLPNVQLTHAGLRVLSVPVACTNVCDPYCQSTQAVATDVDAAAIVPNPDGGITLEKSDAGVVVKQATNCRDLQCKLVTCPAMGVTTTISGTVYDPAGNNPMYNATVYIPVKAKDPLPAFGTGASCDTCSGAAALVALRSTQTDSSGNFTLSDVPAGASIPIVVQMGKWRREILLTSVTNCASNAVTSNCTAPNPADCVFRLPKNHSDGYDPVAGTYTKADIPKLAIVTGSADPFDCLLLKAGLDPAEFGDGNSSKRFHHYYSDSNPGNKLSATYGAAIAGSTLWNNLNGAGSNLMSYDVLLLPCEGGNYDKQAGSNTPYQNLISYADAGGRAFATHYSYTWLQYASVKSYVPAPNNWSAVAKWTHSTGSTNTQDPMSTTVDTSFPKGGVYSTWLQNVAATATPSKLTVHEGRQDLTTVGAATQSWMTAHDTAYPTAPDYSPLFTFNTPYAAPTANQCGRVVYSDFHVSANALVAANQCLTAADCGYTASCTGATPGVVGQCSEQCDTSADCPATSYACNGAVVGKCQLNACTKTTDCPTGETCNTLTGTCSCSAATAATECGSGVCSSTTCKAGHACTSSAGCGLGTCGGGTCTKSGSNAAGACHKSLDCGLGTCGGGTNDGTCTAGTACHVDANCGASGTCGAGTGATAGTCSTNAAVCHSGGACDSGSCTGGTCSTSATACHIDANCDGGVACGAGTGATVGACSTNAAVCHSAAACDSGACTGGTCSTGITTLCHKAADCDSNTCTGGTCSTGTTTVCHKAADCDSNTCTGGTCSTGTATVCHKAADCDSNTCTGGTCSTGTTTACHNAAACDSGSCTGGTCSTGIATTCHKAADCDSGICGATKGTCTQTCPSGANKGLACTTNAFCGGSVICSSASAACSVDTDCTSSGAVCLNVKCSAKACGDDSTCGVSNLCNTAKCTASSACTNDSACPASNLCNNAKCTASPACTNDSACPASKLCNNAKCTASPACTNDSACSASKLCNNAKCTASPACTGDSACPASNQCNNAKCTALSCAGDTACSVSKQCNGAKCATAACAGDSTCSVSNQCNNAKCTVATCAGDNACSVSKQCNGAKCNASGCSNDAQCPTGVLCNNAKCTNPASCGSRTDCGTSVSDVCASAFCTTNACSANADCGTGGTCNGGSCQTGIDCIGLAGCGTDETCNGFAQGLCQKACTKNSDCAPDLCIAGKCGGCTNSAQCNDNAYAASCAGIPAGNYGKCSVYTAGMFPAACRQGALSPQEKALEFMFFDLTSCVSPDDLTPPGTAVVPGYDPATFVQDYTANCSDGNKPIWREFDWQATIPDSASIVITAQSGDTLATLAPAVPLVVATATTDTMVGSTGTNFDYALIDAGKNTALSGPFNKTSPPTPSRNLLRLTITLNPTGDNLVAPALLKWKVQYDCAPAE